ncbi:MAG: lysozyme inhibitor LprI family protein [Janthinobacterium lividum]
MAIRLGLGGAILALGLTAGVASGAEQWAPDQNVCNQQENTLAIVQCLQERTSFWDRRLNQAWKAVNASLASEPQRVVALKTAEQAWLKFREANCAFQYSQGGTIRQIATASCMLEMTQNRAIELQKELSP